MTRKSSGSSASDLELRSCRSAGWTSAAAAQRGRTSAAGVGKPLPSLYPRKVKKELDSEIYDFLKLLLIKITTENN